MIVAQPSIRIISDSNYQEMLIKLERIGRVCYKTEDHIREGSSENFIRGIMGTGHESIIEHQTITVCVTCDRGVSHEIVRHRIAAYSQESTRYCNYTLDKFSNQITCIDPSTGFTYDLDQDTDRKKYEIWQEACRQAEQHYFELLELGATPQEARSVLPNSLKTEIMMTMDLREWRHFLRIRTGEAAHPQMRQIASMILKEFINRYPVFFEDFVKE